MPDCLVAAVGGGSNAMGLFYPFLNDRDVRLIGVEAAGHGIASGKHAAPLCAGEVGVLHGNKTFLLQDKDGQILLPIPFPPDSITRRGAGACVAQGDGPCHLRLDYR